MLRLNSTVAWQDARGMVKGALVWLGVWGILPPSTVHRLLTTLGLKHR